MAYFEVYFAMRKSLQFLVLLRPQQWIKNLFIFIPVFFAGELGDFSRWGALAWAFLAFCLISSCIYVINDIRDLDQDKLHPEKSKRPIAAGAISKREAWALAASLLPAGLLVARYADSQMFLVVLIGYFVANLGYSFGLRKVSILDIIIVSSGFVLRVAGGGLVADVPISPWMMMMVFLLALFLAVAKRRDDLLVFYRSGRVMRKSLETYNLDYINSLLVMISGIIVVAYLMYVISPEVMARFQAPHLYLTSIFVIAGVMRYLQITLVENRSGSPTRVLYQDNFIRFTVLGWMLVFYYIIYQR